MKKLSCSWQNCRQNRFPMLTLTIWDCKIKKKIKRGNSEFLSSSTVMSCKWIDNKSDLLLLTALERLNHLLTVQQKEKGSKLKIVITCPKVVKLYNNGMRGVDLMDQRTASYWLDCKPFICFYLRIFFDSMDLAYVNSYIVYNMRNPDKLTFLYFKIIVVKNLIQ